jgi:hypothetical protein
VREKRQRRGSENGSDGVRVVNYDFRSVAVFAPACARRDTESVKALAVSVWDEIRQEFVRAIQKTIDWLWSDQGEHRDTE